jgi:hypothetical protein
MCEGPEPYDVVTTGVYFEKKSAHAFAMRAGKLVQEELPATTERSVVFRKAFELTEKLVGQPAKIASHKLGDHGEPTTTLDDSVWTGAAAKH